MSTVDIGFVGRPLSNWKTIYIKVERRNAMKNLSTILSVISMVLDVAVVILSIITIRRIAADRKEN